MSLHSQGEQEASPRYRSLPHAACSSRPETGQRRPWNNEPTVPIVGELMPRKRLEGRALNWRVDGVKSQRHRTGAEKTPAPCQSGRGTLAAGGWQEWPG
ncbi:hypothetical protein B6107_18790 [Salmonella enterica]|nr:hypothetical protein [Salmonella enterica]